jgi:hypothetical protein
MSVLNKNLKQNINEHKFCMGPLCFLHSLFQSLFCHSLTSITSFLFFSLFFSFDSPSFITLCLITTPSLFCVSMVFHYSMFHYSLLRCCSMLHYCSMFCYPLLFRVSLPFVSMLFYASLPWSLYVLLSFCCSIFLCSFTILCFLVTLCFIV